MDHWLQYEFECVDSVDNIAQEQGTKERRIGGWENAHSDVVKVEHQIEIGAQEHKGFDQIDHPNVNLSVVGLSVPLKVVADWVGSFD